jgi:hypothetical protein
MSFGLVCHPQASDAVYGMVLLCFSQNAKRNRLDFCKMRGRSLINPAPTVVFQMAWFKQEKDRTPLMPKWNQQTETNMSNKALGIALVAIGIVLVVFGIHAADSIGSDFSRFFTGNPTDKSMWLLLGGVTSLVLGCVLTLRPAR